MKGSKKINKRISILLVCVMLITVLGACGKNTVESGNDANSAVINSTNENSADNTAGNTNDASDTQQMKEPMAMGRYVESVTDLSGRIGGYRNNLFRLEDGTLIITDGSMPFLVSRDNGETWEEEEREWRARLEEAGHYIQSIAIGPDNTVVAIYSDKDENGKYVQRLLFVKADGTEVSVENPAGVDEFYPSNVGIAENGRIFVCIFGDDNIYEVKEDGSSELFLTVDDGKPGLMQFQGNLLIMDGSGYSAPLLYDIEKEEYVEDEILENFVKEEYDGGNKFNMDDGYEMFFFPGEEDILYLAGEKGLHRHVIGGSAIEQIIDGGLCTFGNPAYRVESVVLLDNNEFLALFTGSRLVHFVYDPDITTVPNERLRVYSLKENSTIQQAISLYQTANPEVYVEYEIGMEKDSSVTREDALKTLNTKIMAGEGPDVLVLDNMPLDSYIEKGLLADLTPIINGLGGEEELFGNIVNAMKEKDGIYAMPCEIEIPVILAQKEYMSGLTDLEGIADTVEKLREDNPEKNLISLCTEKGVLRFFGMVCVPAWTDEDGSLNKEAVTEYLQQAKRIYDAQIDGLSDKFIDSYKRGNESWMQEFGETRDDSVYLRRGSNAMDYVGSFSYLMEGTVSSLWSYAELISINRVKGFEDSEWTVMDGQSSNVFCAETLLGISAASPYTAQAEDFVKLCLSKENQIHLFNGLAVNKAALEESCIANPADLGENGEYGYESSSNEEGEMVSFVSYWPDESQVARLKQCIESADTAYIEDAMLESVVYEEGTAYLQGTKSLEEAVSAIEKKVSIYMAE